MLSACLALVIPNVVFLAILYVARSLPVQPIGDHIAMALKRNDIPAHLKDFVFLDSARGVEPWGDADMMRMALYRGTSKWQDTLAPRLLEPTDGVTRSRGEQLYGAVFGTVPFDPNSGYYHRYWFGNMAATSFLLSVFDVRQARLVLMNISYFLFMFIPLLAYAQCKRLGIVLGVICGFGIWFSSLPYHGQTFAYAPAFIWSQLVVLPVLWFRQAPRSTGSVIPLGLVLRAIAAFVEPMSGAFVLAACLFFLALHFSMPNPKRGRQAFQIAVIGLCAFLGGMIASVLFKQTMVSLFFGWNQTFGVFLGQLRWRMGLTGEKISYLKLIMSVGESLGYLTFGSFWFMHVLVFGSGVAFLIGSVLGAIDIARNKRNTRRFDYIAVLVSITIVAAWYFLLPSHNVIHAWITVRLLYIPFAMAWVLLWMSSTSLFMPAMSPASLSARAAAVAPGAKRSTEFRAARRRSLHRRR